MDWFLYDIGLRHERVKQHETVKYHGCQLDAKLSGEALASKVLKK